MKKLSFMLLAVILLTACSRKTSVGTSLSQKSNLYQFYVDLTKVENDKLEISLITPKVNTDQLTYMLPKIVPGTYSNYDFGRYVTSFKAYDAKGDTLAVERKDLNSWTIKNARSLYKLSYKVDDTWDSPEIKGPYVFEPCGSGIDANLKFVINTFCFFGYFEGMKKVPYRLTFTKPEGFYGATSMNFVSTNANKDVFEIADYMDLSDSPILYTRPDTTVLKIGGADILISVFSPNKAANSKEIAANISSMLNAQKEYLGGKLPIQKYAFLINLSDDLSNGSYGALEHSYSSFYFLTEGTSKELAQTIRDEAAHEFFHIITPLSIHSEEIGDFDYNNPKMSKHLWLYEGGTEYAAGLMQIKYGLIDMPFYLDMLSEKINVKASMNDKVPFTEISKKILDEYEKEFYNVYNKGALINLVLDIKLRQLSDGKYGVQNLMGDLAKTYGKTQSFKDDELFDKITALTYPEIRAFFAKYVEGQELLPLAQIFQLVGIDYQPEVMVKKIDFGTSNINYNEKTTRLRLFDLSDINEFGKKMNYQLNDEILNLNGIPFIPGKAKAIYENFKHNAKEGDILTLEVVRTNSQGKEEIVKLSSPVFAANVLEKHLLKLMENPSQAQLKLRKDWLSIGN